MSTNPTQERFQAAYEGKPSWDLGRPQPALVEIADQITGAVLDAGCGTGDNALFFAQRGHDVLGIDFVQFPVKEAKRKAEELGVQAEFLQMDALKLPSLDRQFDSVIDCGLFHVLSDADRRAYVAALLSVTKPGSRLFLMCFSDQEPHDRGPRRIRQEEIRAAFADGWMVESITATHFEPNPQSKETFADGGPRAWFAVIRRGRGNGDTQRSPLEADQPGLSTTM
jgi:ubiquinone/menaquinone biosynthesis C-methylase UbiE